MNCKPGDLAVIVRSLAGNEGKLVIVRSWRGYYRFLEGAVRSDVWCCECLSPIVGVLGIVTEPGDTRHFSDSDLRPIRDPGDDARDETLSWKTVPTKELA